MALNQVEWEGLDFRERYDTEAQVQRDGNRYLRQRGFVVKVFATDKSKRRQETGWFDTVAWRRGWTLFVEYKAPGGELRESQREFHELIRPHLGRQEILVIADHPLAVVAAVAECRGEAR
jgi:hypothetical protein